jgi:(2R)-3-sulfolactate dehydrogenase (NADP+)
MSTESPRLTVDAAHALAVRVLTANRVSSDNAAAVARALVDAELTGQDGHGLRRLPTYSAQARVGKVDGFAIPQADRLRPGVLAVDAAHGFAYPALDLACARLPEMARAQGVALAGIRRSHHAGVAGLAVEALARQGLVALMFANASSTMAPWGGRRPFFGTNPWSMAAPRVGAPLILDSSSSATAYVNLANAAAKGEAIPPEWALDATGRPTTDAGMALEGTIAPAGGHKGSALALMVEVLAAGLTGAHFSHEASSLGDDLGGPPRLGQMLIAIHPGQAGFAPRIEALLAAMASQPGVRVPGDRRHAHRQRAEAEGVAVDDDLMGRLVSLADGR